MLAVLVGIDDDGLEIFPTHRVTTGAVPDLDGQLRQTPLAEPRRGGRRARGGRA